MKIVLSEAEIKEAIKEYLSIYKSMNVKVGVIDLKSKEGYYDGVVEFSAEIDV
jgi:hypothetical protein